MKETTCTHCSECFQDFRPDEIVWFSRNFCFCTNCKTQLQIQDGEARKVPVMDTAQVEATLGGMVDLISQLFSDAEENRLHINISYDGRNSVHVIKQYVFFQLFRQYDVIKLEEKRKCDYEASVEIDGIKFFTLLDHEEYKKFILKSA
ncbi:hypothetical protein LG296_01525 [Ureibacillus chungkukjangi]|uniref:hypothetical protein n=1 Tax=Ureibacillus chungkukjangi TaxID=1202712 RepID=UPI00384D873D